MTDNNHNLTFINKYRFWLVLVIAAGIIQLPIISIPFKWLESYFHEISHGIAALVTGGSIIKIELFPNGAGLCTTQGGSRFFISFFGYAGAALWGVLIYSIASANMRMAQLFSAFLALLLISSMLFWIRDLLTFVIVLFLLAIFIAKFKFSKLIYLQISLQVTGALVLLNSVKSPWYLVDGRSLGDGATLAKLTGLPEILWVLMWFILGLAGIIVLVKKTVN